MSGTSGNRWARSATSVGVDSPALFPPPGRRGFPPTTIQVWMYMIALSFAASSMIGSLFGWLHVTPAGSRHST